MQLSDILLVIHLPLTTLTQPRHSNDIRRLTHRDPILLFTRNASNNYFRHNNSTINHNADLR